MSPHHQSLPFYPTYKTEIRGHVVVWWFDKDFSQSRYNFKNGPISSNACTIITVLLAARCHYQHLQIVPAHKYELPQDVVYTFARCILEGNDTHSRLRKTGVLENINLTIPEAIQGVGRELRSIVEWKTELCTDIEGSLYNNIKQYLIEWFSTDLYEEHPDLYIILIADSRSVLMVYQDVFDLVRFFIHTPPKLEITLVDSHQHLEHGAIMAQVPRNRLKALCYWFNCMIIECFDSHPDCYELSFLYFQKGKT